MFGFWCSRPAYPPAENRNLAFESQVGWEFLTVRCRASFDCQSCHFGGQSGSGSCSSVVVVEREHVSRSRVDGFFECLRRDGIEMSFGIMLRAQHSRSVRTK
jgi:hypothetical protein